ncbi:MAG: hypothetical protein K2Y37_25155 [Pirellulales bacterium]|nr:hypothetical protein [Pirellulales bacterium]
MEAEAFEPVQQSLLHFYYSALGLRYSVMLPLAALVGFTLVLLVIIRGRGPLASAAILISLSLPLLVGLHGALDGLIAAFTVIAASDTQPKPSEIAMGWRMALVAPLTGMFLMGPSLLAALVGSVMRSMRDGETRPPAIPR